MNRLLIVEDQGEYAFLLHRHFEHYMPGWEIVIAPTLHEAFSVCARSKIQLIILDLSLIDSPPEKTVDAIVALRLSAPVVVLTGSTIRETPTFTDCFQKGAEDVYEKSTMHGGGLIYFIYCCQSAIARHAARHQDA